MDRYQVEELRAVTGVRPERDWIERSHPTLPEYRLHSADAGPTDVSALNPGDAGST